MICKSGIYKIENTVNSKCYIGSAAHIKNRVQDHKRLLRLNRHCNNYLQNTWNKYGEDNFRFEVLLYCDKENLLFYEQRAIDVYKAVNGCGYNICPVAGNQLGFSHSEETKQKLSETNRGKVASEETKRKMSVANKGQVPWMKGNYHSVEAKVRISEARKGRKHSLESRRKISIGSKGRVHSDEAKQKMALAHQGVPLSKETRLKMAQSHMGHSVSVETRLKISEAAKRRRRNNGKFMSESLLV